MDVADHTRNDAKLGLKSINNVFMVKLESGF